ncbi:hypothetical protein BH24CHL7_BH24CHL7_14080 [soil metagenome]
MVIDCNNIAYVGSERPDGVRGIETVGVIVPGLIDLHGHGLSEPPLDGRSVAHQHYR